MRAMDSIVGRGRGGVDPGGGIRPVWESRGRAIDRSEVLTGEIGQTTFRVG